MISDDTSEYIAPALVQRFPDAMETDAVMDGAKS